MMCLNSGLRSETTVMELDDRLTQARENHYLISCQMTVG